jgi:hypothetical protein
LRNCSAVGVKGAKPLRNCLRNPKCGTSLVAQCTLALDMPLFISSLICAADQTAAA